MGTASDSVSVKLDSATDDWVCTITNTSTLFGDLTVIKHLVPDTAPGAFDLLVNGNVEKASARDGDRAELTHIPFGLYTVAEQIAASQTVTLANYNIHTVCIDQSTEPATVVWNQAGPTASVTLSREHSNIQCTITNEHIPPPAVAHLTVVKKLVPSSDPEPSTSSSMRKMGRERRRRRADARARTHTRHGQGQRARGGRDQPRQLFDQHHLQASSAVRRHSDGSRRAFSLQIEG